MNGQDTQVIYPSDTWASSPIQHYIGQYSGGYGAYYIDEVKLFNEAILPYGAYFTGNGAVDTDVAHKDLLFYADFEGATETIRLTDKINSVVGTLNSSAAITTGSKLVGSYGFDATSDTDDYVEWAVTSQNIFNWAEGTILFWVNCQSFSADQEPFKAEDDVSNEITIESRGTDEARIALIIGGVANNSSDTTANVLELNIWKLWRLSWNRADERYTLWVNSVEVASITSTTGTWGGDGTGILRFSDDINIWIDQIYVTNKENAPEIWTAMGKPLHLPLIDKE